MKKRDKSKGVFLTAEQMKHIATDPKTLLKVMNQGHFINTVDITLSPEETIVRKSLIGYLKNPSTYDGMCISVNEFPFMLLFQDANPYEYLRKILQKYFRIIPEWVKTYVQKYYEIYNNRIIMTEFREELSATLRRPEISNQFVDMRTIDTMFDDPKRPFDKAFRLVGLIDSTSIKPSLLKDLHYISTQYDTIKLTT